MVQARPGGLGGGQRGTMDLRRHAQHQRAAGGLVWCLTKLSAGLQIVVDRFLKRQTQGGHGVSVKTHNVRYASHLAHQDIAAVIERNAGRPALVARNVSMTLLHLSL